MELRTCTELSGIYLKLIRILRSPPMGGVCCQFLNRPRRHCLLTRWACAMEPCKSLNVYVSCPTPYYNASKLPALISPGAGALRALSVSSYFRQVRKTLCFQHFLGLCSIECTLCAGTPLSLVTIRPLSNPRALATCPGQIIPCAGDTGTQFLP